MNFTIACIAGICLYLALRRLIEAYAKGRVRDEVLALLKYLARPEGLAIRYCDLEDPKRFLEDLISQSSSKLGISISLKARRDLIAAHQGYLQKIFNDLKYKRSLIIGDIRYQLSNIEKEILSGRVYSDAYAADLKRLSDRALEKAVLSILVDAGFTAVWKGEKGKDFGADVLITAPIKAVVQCKGWKGKVGNGDVLKTIGSNNYYKSSVGLIIGTSGFTDSAVDAAKQCRDQVVLLDTLGFLRWVRSNSKKRPEEIRKLEALKQQLSKELSFISDPKRTLDELKALAG